MNKWKIVFTFVILAAGVTFSGAMEVTKYDKISNLNTQNRMNVHHSNHPFLNPPFVNSRGTLLNILPHEIWEEVVSWLSFSEQQRFRGNEKAAVSIVRESQKKGRPLAGLVCAYTQHKKITLLSDFSSYCFFPHNYAIHHFRNWLHTGRVGLKLDVCFSHSPGSDWRIRYKDRGFKDVIYTPYRPFIRFALEQDVSIWESANLRDKCGDIPGSYGNSPLHSVMRLKCDDLLKTFLRRMDLVKLCMTPVTIKGNAGNTPLHSLAKYGTLEMLQIFLPQTSLINLCLLPENIKGENGNSPLHHLAKYADASMLHFFISCPTYTDSCLDGENIKGESGNTPLHLVAKRGQKDIVEAFLDYPEYVRECLLPGNIKGEQGKSPIQLAEKGGFPEIAEMIREAASHWPLLQRGS